MSDLRLSELLKVLDLAALRDQRRAGQMMRAVIKQYRRISVEEAARQLREALDAPNRQSAEARTKMVLRALDIAVRELKLPPQRAEQIIRLAVRERIQNLDELLLLQNPELSFNHPREVQARAVGVARQQMNNYWDKEQRRFRNDVAKTVRQAIRDGLPAEKAADLLQERLGVSRNRAILIAVDQMLTAQANADKQRQRDMNIEEYLWRTMADQRVRGKPSGKYPKAMPSHWARHNKKYKWSESAELYPGKEIRCRCRAVPIVTGGRALTRRGEGEDKAPPLPERPSSYAPAGPSAEDNFNIPTEPAFDEALEGLTLISEVHGGANLPPVRVRQATPQNQMNDDEPAAYEPETRDNSARGILLNPRNPATPAEFIHEGGHFFDHQVFGVRGQYASESHPDLEEWRQAVQNSALVQHLRHLSEQETVEWSGRIRAVRHDQVEYLLKGRELFARAYTQYIAMQNGGLSIREELGSRVHQETHPLLYPEQWDAEDFEPIARAIEALLLKRGLVK